MKELKELLTDSCDEGFGDYQPEDSKSNNSAREKSQASLNNYTGSVVNPNVDGPIVICGGLATDGLRGHTPLMHILIIPLVRPIPTAPSTLALHHELTSTPDEVIISAA